MKLLKVEKYGGTLRNEKLNLETNTCTGRSTMNECQNVGV